MHSEAPIDAKMLVFARVFDIAYTCLATWERLGLGAGLRFFVTVSSKYQIQRERVWLWPRKTAPLAKLRSK